MVLVAMGMVFIAMRSFAQSSGMALIPAGSFMMGDSFNESWSADLPVHSVYVSALYMDKFDVTKALWDGGYQWATNHGYSFDYAGSGKATNHPVQTINWYDAVKWCNARSEKEGLNPCYYTSAGQTIVYRTGQVGLTNTCVNWAANGYRLPTEAEWEKAARGGMSGQRFPWGNTISWSQANLNALPQANFNTNPPGYAYDLDPTNGYNPAFNDGIFPFTSPVGYFAPNGYGLYDMAGNVWQWCWDWLDVKYYSISPSIDPHGPLAGYAFGYTNSFRVKRGGSFVGWPNNLLLALRGNVYSDLTIPDYDIGFRCVRISLQNSPVIISQPTNQITQVRSNVIFSVSVDGQSPLNYQWQFNRQNLTGQTAPSLSLTNVQFANAGGYSVVITNAYGSVTSAVAQLTVYNNIVFTQTNRTPTTEIGNATIPTDPTHFKVFYNGMFQPGISVDTNKMTVVLTHGWNDNPYTWPISMASEIQANLPSPAPNIVAWDWSSEASSAWYDLGLIADKTTGQGWRMCQTLLQSLGANYSKPIHFIGHSLGTLVNGAAAGYLEENGWSGTNIQMTLFDEAEVAWGFDNGVWKSVTSLATLSANSSIPTAPTYVGPLPRQYAWADNYISAFGLLHSGAVNVVLTNGFPDTAHNPTTLYNEVVAFHGYPHVWYDETIQTDVSTLGFRWSFERSGFNGAPATNSYYIQSGSQWNTVGTNFVSMSQLLDARFQKYLNVLGATGLQTVGNAMTDNGQVSGQMLATGPANAWDMLVKLKTGSGGNSPQVQILGATTKAGPVPMAGSAGNTPAYAWIPLNIPSNTVSMSFDFMLQGNGNQDSFQAALNGTNILSLEAVLIQTNVTLNTGLFDVSKYAGQQVELFLGIVGGTSTNATITANNFQFYSILPPSLQIQLSGTNVVLTWPLSGTGYILESANQLTSPGLWSTVTNVPVIVNFQFTVTNQISSGSVFYRLATVTVPTLRAQLSGSNIILSWPAAASGFTLETTTNLADPNSWTQVAATPALVSQQFQVTNNVSSGRCFYRLKQ